MRSILLFALLIGALAFGTEPGITIAKNIPEGKLGPRIAILTVIMSGKNAFGAEMPSYDKVVSFGTKTKQLYAKKHGYDFIIASEPINTCFERPAHRKLEPHWNKIALIAKYLESYDWIFWTDADSAILNFDIKLESFLDDDFDLIVCTESSQRGPPVPYFVGFNSGQMFFKNSELSKEILLTSWEMQDICVPSWYEQAALNDACRIGDRKSHVKTHPAADFNASITQFQEGDFIIHYYAIHGDRLYNCFKNLEKKYGSWLKAEERRINHVR